MNQTHRILSFLRLVNSISLNGTYSRYCQVTQFSRSIPPLSAPLHISVFPNTNHQYLLFSSNTQSVIERVLTTEDWSKKLEQDLSKSNLEFSHESVVYILKRLDKDPPKSFNFFNWVTEKYGFKPSSGVYSLLLQILANEESIKDFWVVVTKMKEQGCYIDKDTYRTILTGFKYKKMVNDASAFTHFYNRMIESNTMDGVVKEVVEIVKGSDWGHEVEKQLTDVKLSLSDNFVERVLKELRLSPLKALKIFKWFSNGCGFEHNTVTYNAVLRVLGKDESIAEFWSMLKEMKNKGHDLDLDTYVKIARRFQKNQMLDDAVQLYEHMMDGPYKPSINECSLLLRCISGTKEPNLDLVFRVATKYEQAGVSLSKIVYDGIHRSLTSAGSFNEAEKIIKVMKNKGYEPDNITYSQLIYGLGKSGRLEEACQVLDVMEANGCVPDLKTWTVLIQRHCAASEMDKALFYFAKMLEKNLVADADLLDILVNGFINQRRIGSAYNLLLELIDSVRLRPWQATYKNLIENLLGERKLEEALNLLKRMKKHNYPPSPEPFVQHISKFGSVEDALDFLKALSVKEYPTVAAYQHVFQSFFQEGRYSEANDLLYKCPYHVRKHKAICSLFGSVEKRSSSGA